MRSMRARILGSMVLVMGFSVVVTVVFCTHFIYGLIVIQTRDQLLLQLDKAVQILQDGQLEDLAPTDLPLRFKKRQFNADFYIVDGSDIIKAASNESLLNQQSGLELIKQAGVTSFQGNQVMYVYQKMDEYTVVLYTPEQPLKQMGYHLIRLVAVSMTVSCLILFAIGFLFLWKITRPINKLKEAVNHYDPYRGNLSITRVGSTEIDELIITFQSMSDRIRKHHEQQIEFLQNISHELRTPLMSIQGYAVAIEDQVVSQEKGLSIITNESYRLIRMVDRLLELTRLENPAFSEEESDIDLGDMIKQAVEVLTANADERGVHIQWSGSETKISAPGEQLFQMIINLLQNAIRYAATEVKISFDGNRQTWFLSVEDDGAGVAEGMQDRIFDRYYKGEAGQTGLGLSICRQIAESLQGELRYNASSMGGACFTFEFKGISEKHGHASL